MNEPMTPSSPPPGPPGTPPPPAAPPPGGPPARPGLPWERSKDLGSLLETAKLLITSPGQAYAEAREKGDYASPLIFAIVLGIIGAIFSQLWSLLFSPAAFMPMGDMGDLPPEFRQMMESFAVAGPGSVVLSVVLAPIYVLLGLFIGGAVVHLVLKLIGGLQDSTAGFEGTLRSLSYSYVAWLGYIVPVVGFLIVIVWSIVLNVIGLSTLHRTSQGKALAGLLIPIVLCCCIVIVLGAAFGAAIGGIIAAASGN